MGKKNKNKFGKNGLVCRDVNNSTMNNLIGDNNQLNIYNYNVIQYVINDSESRTNDGFRNLLWSIFKNTHEDNHIFSGFVNNIEYKDKKLYVANIYWNKRIYATNHTVLYPGNVNDFNKGDFIIFKGKIDNYRRKDGTKDIGIQNIKLVRKQVFPELTINHYDKEQIDLDYLKSLDSDLLLHIFDIQFRRIGIKIEKYKDISPDMYKSILFNIFYENRKEQDMICTRLNILDGNKDILKLVEWIMYIRYLVCEVNMISPYMVYNMLLLIFSDNKISMSEEYQYYTTLAKYSKFISSLQYNQINESFNHYLNHYINELKSIF